MRKRKKRHRRLLAALIATALLVPGSALALWAAIHHFPWLGPLLADGARSVVGPNPIAQLEDIAYAAQDRWNRYHRAEEVPQAYWEAPPSAAPPAPSAPLPTKPTFKPADVPPVHTSWSAPGDGAWLPVVDARNADDPALMFKTLLHPDRSRSWAAVTVVALDLQHVDLHLVAGRYEPKATESEARGYKRTGLIEPRHHASLLAAFNGGFKLEHGHYGMRVDNVTLVRPRKGSCTIVGERDGTIRVGPWEKFAEDNERFRWWRQTPACMVEDGQVHRALQVEGNTAWGCTVGGETVIRRSALGVDDDGKVLYVGIGDSTTARTIAIAMRHAGAKYVAQLDVNWSFPKFLVYQPKELGSSELVGSPVSKGFEYSEDDYVRKVSARDFFYVTRKEPPQTRDR